DDAQVQFVSRVPLRYMTLPAAKPRRRAAGSSTTATTPPAPSGLWNLLKVQWAVARNKHGFVDADDVKVAILDTGVDAGHPDLTVAQYIHDHPDTPQLSGIKDIAGHGTHVAGTVAATIGNAAGINGICRCRLMCWKIFNDETTHIPSLGRFTYVVDPLMYQRALADCLDEDIDVINLSIGGTQPPDPQERQLLNALLANGTTIVAAMGNHRALGSPISYPAAVPDVIAVGATSIDDSVATFSNRGDHITVSAPGVSIWSTMPTYAGQSGFDAVIGTGGAAKEGKAIPRETNYAALNGTSMATPHVTGAVALLVAKSGRQGPTATADALKTLSDHVAGMGNRDFHPDYGGGRLNLDRLL
ncbi:MAG: S8 family peptidase, partial [Thermoanaerobaculia bacterium]